MDSDRGNGAISQGGISRSGLVGDYRQSVRNSGSDVLLQHEGIDRANDAGAKKHAVGQTAPQNLKKPSLYTHIDRRSVSDSTSLRRLAKLYSRFPADDAIKTTPHHDVDTAQDDFTDRRCKGGQGCAPSFSLPPPSLRALLSLLVRRCSALMRHLSQHQLPHTFRLFLRLARAPKVDKRSSSANSGTSGRSTPRPRSGPSRTARPLWKIPERHALLLKEGHARTVNHVPERLLPMSRVHPAFGEGGAASVSR
jgi:hypothetical protein